MHHTTYVERLVNLLDPEANVFLNVTAEEAEEAVRSGDAQAGLAEFGDLWLNSALKPAM